MKHGVDPLQCAVISPQSAAKLPMRQPGAVHERLVRYISALAFRGSLLVLKEFSYDPTAAVRSARQTRLRCRP
jgi:hypothetical protein